MGGCGLGQKVLFRVNCNLICCVPGQIQGWETQGELLVLPQLNPGVQGEHLLRQPSWNAASVLVACVCPVYLVDELILISVPLSPIAGLVVAPLTFFNTWWVWFKSYEKSVLFWGMDMEFKDKIMWIAPRKWNVSRVWFSRRRYRVTCRQFTSISTGVGLTNSPLSARFLKINLHATIMSYYLFKSLPMTEDRIEIYLFFILNTISLKTLFFLM